MSTGPHEPQSISGEAAGVPFIAFAPDTDHDAAMTVVVWHLHDPPRSETAMAAALPLRGIDAWRLYLGLPLSGKRLPPGGLDAFFALGYEDAVLNLYGPTVHQAVREFPAALTELRRRHGLGRGAIALVGASIGALVAASVVAAGEPAVAALALISPALRLESVVAMNERRFAVTYAWTDESRAVAAELDFITLPCDATVESPSDTGFRSPRGAFGPLVLCCCASGRTRFLSRRQTTQAQRRATRQLPLARDLDPVAASGGQLSFARSRRWANDNSN
jgi:pimeloyl-ACP methyl ester carboxylesterase